MSRIEANFVVENEAAPTNLQNIIVDYSLLQYILVHYTIFEHVIVFYSTLSYMMCAIGCAVYGFILGRAAS